MGINGVSPYVNTYTYSNVKDENVKASKNNEKKTEEVNNSQNVSAKDRAADYYSYLQKKYDCVKNGSVTLSGAYVNECANNPQKAKELEENLAFFKQSYESGYQSAKANAQAIGARLVNHTESWSIDSTGNVTMMAATTVTSDTGVKGWKELQEERQEKLKEKREEEKKQEERLQEKKEAQERIDERLVIKEGKNEISDAYHKAIDISV